MNKAFSPAVLLIWGLCLPLAVLCGLLIATPLSWVTFGMLAVVFLVLCSPLLIKWHHALLIFSWHSFFIVFFVPGEPSATLTVVVEFAVTLFPGWMDVPNPVAETRTSYVPAARLGIE